jgi:8-oxo-dGTP pyrophosphatase MutT (NUDIX family)
MVHVAVWVFQSVRKAAWFVTRPKTVGVHGIPLTPEGKIVLVTLSYARGWRLPGGGQKATEDSRTAMLRELREEIGLTSYESADLVSSFAHRPDYRSGEASLFVVRGVRYEPRWSFEVKAVGEFCLRDLPTDTAQITRQLLALAVGHIPEADAKTK